MAENGLEPGSDSGPDSGPGAGSGSGPGSGPELGPDVGTSPLLAVRHLRLSHFRSYAQCRLEFAPGPIAIFGDNGAGKTNLLEALSLLSPGRGLRKAKPDDIARTPARIGWKLAAEMTGPAGLSEIETSAEFGAARQVAVNGKPARQTALGALARVIWLVPVMDRLWLEGAADRRQFLDRITLSIFPDHAGAVLAYDKAMRERNRLLKDGVQDPAWYGALETQMAQHGARISAHRRAALDRIAEAQDGARTAFPHATLGLDGAGPEAEDALAAALAAGRAQDMAAGRALTGPHRADLTAIYSAKDMAARLCSTGEQKALLVSLILANARAVMAGFGAPPILLLDEIAAHLDAGRRAALYDEIHGLGAQAFMTGTGRELFQPLGARAQYFTARETDTGTVLEGS